jgi:hypothetical protein
MSLPAALMMSLALAFVTGCSTPRRAELRDARSHHPIVGASVSVSPLSYSLLRGGRGVTSHDGGVDLRVPHARLLALYVHLDDGKFFSVGGLEPDSLPDGWCDMGLGSNNAAGQRVEFRFVPRP